MTKETVDAEKRKWNAFWETIPGWLRTAIVSLTLASGASYGTAQLNHKEPTDEATLRRVIREELAPMKAGFKAFVATAPAKTQLQVLQAMSRAEDKIKEGQP